MTTTNRPPIAASAVLGHGPESLTFWLPTVPGHLFLQYTQPKGTA